MGHTRSGPCYDLTENRRTRDLGLLDLSGGAVRYDRKCAGKRNWLQPALAGRPYTAARQRLSDSSPTQPAWPTRATASPSPTEETCSLFIEAFSARRRSSLTEHPSPRAAITSKVSAMLSAKQVTGLPVISCLLPVVFVHFSRRRACVHRSVSQGI